MDIGRPGMPLVESHVSHLSSAHADNICCHASLLLGSMRALAHIEQSVCVQVLTCIGAIVNVKRIPEKWFHVKDPRTPGRFDYWLNSHQIMHVLVAWAMAHYGLGATFDYMHFAKETQCPAWELAL